MPEPSTGFRILFVCTGNICRSPTGERLLAHRLHERLGDPQPFAVSSAGTSALVGEPIYADSARLLTARGVATSNFAARELQPQLANSADLVLAMTREHRAATARLAPRALRRLFTLREFARLLDQSRQDWPRDTEPVQRARRLIELAQRRRGLSGPVEAALDDVPDPYRRRADVFELALSLISDSVDVVVDAFCGTQPHGRD